jgi:RNA polymerase sigma-70 factor (ECF subfamily)
MEGPTMSAPHCHTAEPELEEAVQVFLGERSRLLRVAQQVVGDRTAAEDVVQDAWLRWQRVDREGVKNPAAFLTTTTTHLAINVIQSARHRHETPTDVVQARGPGPALGPVGSAERASVAERMLGFLMVKLSASELAAYVLRKSFDYPYEEIAGLLATTSPNARQLVRRAQAALGSKRTRRVERAAHRRLVSAYAAATTGDLARLERELVAGLRPCPASPNSPAAVTRARAVRSSPVTGGSVESQVRTRTPGFTGAACRRHAGSRERLDPLVTSSVRSGGHDRETREVLS